MRAPKIPDHVCDKSPPSHHRVPFRTDFHDPWTDSKVHELQCNEEFILDGISAIELVLIKAGLGDDLDCAKVLLAIHEYNRNMGNE
jgi:hypothetical protein